MELSALAELSVRVSRRFLRCLPVRPLGLLLAGGGESDSVSLGGLGLLRVAFFLGFARAFLRGVVASEAELYSELLVVLRRAARFPRFLLVVVRAGGSSSDVRSSSE